MKTKLTVIYLGKTYARTTDHEYTHVVLARESKDRHIANAKSRRNTCDRSNYDFYIKEGRITGTYEEYIEKVIADSLAYIERRDKEGRYEFYAASWHHSQSAALKGHAKVMKYCAEAVIVPVDPA